MVTNYVPEKGDLVWLNFDPQTGHEQKGCRPAICVSHKIYNQKVGLALFCPITSHIKGYPFEIVLNKWSGGSGNTAFPLQKHHHRQFIAPKSIL